MAIDIKKHEHLRDAYEKDTGKEVEETYSGVQGLDNSWDGDEEPSWANWGYVIWLEKQVLEGR